MVGDEPYTLGLDETHRAESRVEHLGGEPRETTQNIAGLRVDEVEPPQCSQPVAFVRVDFLAARLSGFIRHVPPSTCSESPYYQ